MTEESRETVVVSFRAKRSGAAWLDAEAKRRGMSRTDLCREIFRLGRLAYVEKHGTLVK
jgi:hypothetical protein